MKAARSGDDGALAEIRKGGYDLAAIVDAVGPRADAQGFARTILGIYLSRVTARDDAEECLIQAGIKARAQILEEQLAGPTPNVLEEVVVKVLVTSWLELQLAVLREQITGEGGDSIKLAEFKGRRHDRAMSRFLQCVRTLAKLRGIGGPDMLALIQANTNGGPMQVNLAGTGGQPS